MGVFSLGEWAPQVHARFLGSGVTQELHYVLLAFAYRPVTVYGALFQGTSARRVSTRMWVLQPRCSMNTGLGCARFARRY
jgi:hypothetical protein